MGMSKEKVLPPKVLVEKVTEAVPPIVQVRDIIFGEIMKSYDKRFREIERKIDDLRKDKVEREDLAKGLEQLSRTMSRR